MEKILFGDFLSLVPQKIVDVSLIVAKLFQNKQKKTVHIINLKRFNIFF